jgi:hypothetical protein
MHAKSVPQKTKIGIVYLYFDNWHHLISFMAEELELNIPAITMNSS